MTRTGERMLIGVSVALLLSMLVSQAIWGEHARLGASSTASIQSSELAKTVSSSGSGE